MKKNITHNITILQKNIIHKCPVQKSVNICITLLTANANAVQFHSFDWSMCLSNEIL